jgi:hypothetical protein
MDAIGNAKVSKENTTRKKSGVVEIPRSAKLCSKTDLKNHVQQQINRSGRRQSLQYGRKP